MFAPRHTLIITTDQVLARIDLIGRRKLRVQKMWTRTAIETLSLAANVSMALQLGPARAGAVWVLSADFWTEVLGLPADVTAMLNGDQLQQALALEAEAVSGYSAFESRIAAHKISQHASGDSEWWVTQVANDDLTQFANTVRQFGGRLAGVAHPAAVHLTLATPECGDLEASCRAASIESWREENRLEHIESQDSSLDAAATWQRFAQQWAERLAQPTQRPLLIAADAQPLSNSQQTAISAALAILTLCGCALWHWQTARRIEQCDRHLVQLTEQQAEQDKTLAALKSRELRLAKVRQEVFQAHSQQHKLEHDLQLANAAHAQQSLRWVALLNALASSIDNDCWIQKIESKPSQAIVSGLAVDNAAAHRLASALERSLSASGWKGLPAETKPAAAKLVAFTIVMEVRLSPTESADDAEVAALAPSPDQPPSGLLTLHKEKRLSP